jgi:CBS domain-containing protein
MNDFDRLLVADVMEPRVQFAHLDTHGDVLASLMIEGFGGVPVVDGRQRMVGIVTEFDLLSSLLLGKALHDVSAREVMTPDPFTVSPDTPMSLLIPAMQRNLYIRVPVVDRDGVLVGIVARRDILRGYLACAPRPTAEPAG